MWKRLLCANHKARDDEQQLLLDHNTRFSILARERRFGELLQLLSPSSSRSGNHQDTSRQLAGSPPHRKKYSFDVPLPLHFVLRYHPPVSLVNILISLEYTKPEYTDSHGRNALHLACWYNCAVNVIARLVNHKPNLNVPDLLQSRYPLHFLCLDYDASLSETALFVRDVWPHATLHADVFGLTPADILKQQQAISPKVRTLLQAVPPQIASQLTTLERNSPKSSTARMEPAPKHATILHIPIELKETVSDLTNATAFHHHAASVSLHSKSTCSTSMISEHDEEYEQELIVQAVRTKLLSQKGFQLPREETTSRRRQVVDDADWESVRC